MKTPIIPAEDGVTHINIYSKGATELGRVLSNFAYTPFQHPVFGEFDSIEGFWYWLKTGQCHDQLRKLSGFLAKREGKKLPVVQIPHFNEHVKEAIRCKLRQNQDIRIELAESALPFEHYCYFGDANNNPKVVELPQHQWAVDEITLIRTLCKEHRK